MTLKTGYVKYVLSCVYTYIHTYIHAYIYKRITSVVPWWFLVVISRPTAPQLDRYYTENVVQKDVPQKKIEEEENS